MALKGKKQTEEHKLKKVLARKGYRHSEKTKERIAKSLMGKSKGKGIHRNIGENHPNWKGGVTPANKLIRNSMQYRLWRMSIFIRDGRKCIWCGSKEKIQADHIKPFALFPELRFIIDNGRTLCEKCHKTTDTWGNKNLFSL